MVNLRRHVSITKLNIERPRYRPPARPKQIQRDNAQHGAVLSESLAKIRQEYEKTVSGTPLSIEPILVFSLKADQKIDDTQLTRSGLVVLDEDIDKRVYVLTTDGATKLKSRIEQYSQVVLEGSNPRYSWLSALNGEMKTATPEDRLGPKLRRVKIDSEAVYKLDVEFWAVDNRDENTLRMNRLDEYARKHGGRVLDRYVGRFLSIARVQIQGKYVQDLLTEPTIRIIDLPIDGATGVFESLRTSLDQLQNPIPYPPADAPGICVIDSGVMRGHPVLGNAIGETKAFPPGDEVDANGHGTRVAGIALYGDLRECIRNLAFEPEFFLYSARVLDESNRFSENHLIITQMQDAINYFYHTHKCRVFNISIGDPELVYDDGKPSAWAHILDVLARELDIVIVVSAGNLPIFGLGNEEAVSLYQTYPSYFLNGNKQARIIEPATAINVLTVGSLAHTQDSLHSLRYPNDLDSRPIAAKDDVSPFTRRGPGVNNSVKPDVCEYGGNALWHSTRGVRHDPGLGIISTNHNFMDSLFSTGIGSSYAAPKIAHLAAKILKNYPGISANLVRVLIANAACLPSSAAERFTTDEDRLNLYGYGKPELEKAIYSDDNRVTLIADDSIPLDTVTLYEIPIPEEFKERVGERKITVTMAYDPPVRNRLDYAGVKLTFRLFRGLDTQQILDWYAERDLGRQPEPIPSKYECKMDIPSTRRKSSTLQKATFKASRNQSFTEYVDNGGNFHLLVSCSSVWASSDEFPTQRYALAVTIEHEDISIPLYSLIEHQIRLQEKVRVRT